MPEPVPGGKRYPKVYRNAEDHYPPNRRYYEYPTMNFGYDTQNCKGTFRETGPGGTVHTGRDASYTRTITDQHKAIQGVSYHPLGNPQIFLRAEEILSKPSGSKARRRG